jgi:dTDP-4-dehydrorhamnose reductase
MRVMLLGAGGLLGSTLALTAPAEVILRPYRREQLDITDSSRIDASIAKLNPDVIVNAAGYTAVDRAESERDWAFRTNGEAVGHLGRVAAQHGARVVHFSTDYVFDGRSREPYPEDAPTAPVNVYGGSKLAGEIGLRESGAVALVVRTQWLFGTHGHSFARAMWERARTGTRTQVVADQFGRPTYVRDVATAVWRMIALGAEGTFHVANQGIASWFEFAEAIFARVGRSDLLIRCSSKEYGAPAPRPAFSALSTGRAETLLGASCLPHWRDALTRMFGEAPFTISEPAAPTW